jgi:hypothetical protein
LTYPPNNKAAFILNKPLKMWSKKKRTSHSEVRFFFEKGGMTIKIKARTEYNGLTEPTD